MSLLLRMLPNAAPAPTGFVNLINLLIGPSEPVETGPASPTGSPQLIADALIRSLLSNSMSSSTGSSSTGLSTLQEPVAPPVAATRAIARASDNLLLNQAGMQVVLQTAPPTKGTGHQQRGLVQTEVELPTQNDTSGNIPALVASAVPVQPVAELPLVSGALQTAAAEGATGRRQQRGFVPPAAEPAVQNDASGSIPTLVASAVPVQPVAELPLVSGVLQTAAPMGATGRQQRGLMPVEAEPPIQSDTAGNLSTLAAPSIAAEPVVGSPLRTVTQTVAQVSVQKGIPGPRPLERDSTTGTPATIAPAILLAPPILLPAPAAATTQPIRKDLTQDIRQPLPEGTAVLAAPPIPAAKTELTFGLRLTPIEAPETPALPQAEPASTPPFEVAEINTNFPAPNPFTDALPETAPETIAAEPAASPKEASSKSSGASLAVPTETSPRPSAEPAENAAPAVTAVAAVAAAGDQSNVFARSLEGATLVVAPPAGLTEPAPPTAADALRSSMTTASPEPTPPPAPGQGIQGIAVRIALPDAPPVDVQITDRGGQVQVAVRTPDPGLQSSLRQDLGTLVSSLERSGYRAETFVPREGVPQTAASSQTQEPGSGEPGNPSGKHGSGNQSSGNQGGQQHSQQQQGQRGRQLQNWIETMENTA